MGKEEHFCLYQVTIFSIINQILQKTFGASLRKLGCQTKAAVLPNWLLVILS